MNEQAMQEHLRGVLLELDEELRLLLSEGALTKVDVQKIRNQAEISKDALFTARQEASLDDVARGKLMNALVRDLEKSIQNTLDEAIGRKGDRALLIYRLNRVDRKIRLGAVEAGVPQNELDRLQLGMEVLKSYIIRSLPEKGGFWGASKIDVVKIVKNYEQAILESTRNNFELPELGS